MCGRTFGYGTAVAEAAYVIDSAHAEAKSVLNGVGLVKLMGRDAGFIACGATLASQEVNFTLIPEVPFDLEGEHGFLNRLHERLARPRACGGCGGGGSGAGPGQRLGVRP